MVDQDIRHFKTKLDTLLAQLLETDGIAEESAKTVVLDQSSVGRLSRMDAMQQQAMSIERLRRRKLQILNIQAALKRIANDDYGWCLACGDEIDIRRLDFDPTANYCIKCADNQT